MKKTLIPLAAAALMGHAHAQSSVQLFGIVDVGVSQGRGSIANRTQLASSGLAPSQVGFRGVEDLGGGLKAGFWLEAQIQADNGAGAAANTNNQASGSPAPPGLAGGQGLTFNRRSTVSLSGSWGQVILGNDYHGNFWNHVAFDPFGVNGVGTSQAFLSRVGPPLTPSSGPFTGGAGALAARASNSIAYAWGYAPNGLTIIGGGLYAHAMYFLGENASNAANADDGKGFAGRIGYNNGALNIAASVLSAKYLGPATSAPGAVVVGDVRAASLGASWDFGVVKPSVMFEQDEFGPRSGKGWLVGATAPVGVGLLRLSYSTYQTDATGNPRSSKLALGYVHNLSKRTALYTTYARVRNSGGASQSVAGAITAANNSSSGLDLGIRHAF